MYPSIFLTSSTVIFILSAISSSVGSLFNSFSSFSRAVFSEENFENALLGIQLIFLSSSIIEPFILNVAYVSNFSPFDGSNFSIASIRPSIPKLTRSSYSIPGGFPITSLEAIYFT